MKGLGLGLLGGALALVVSLVPQPSHGQIQMVCPLILVCLLLGPMYSTPLWRRIQLSETGSFKTPDLPSRFQRPPPPIL